MTKTSEPSSPFSPAGSVFAAFDRRAAPRVRTVCFDVTVDWNGEVGLFRARNISDNGIMLHIHAGLDPGEPVLVGLSAWLTIPGRVLWCNERYCGIRFERPIDCAALLRAELECKREQRRGGLRLAATRLATSYAENGIRAVKIINVSHRGMGLAHDGTLDTDMRLKLIVENGIECEARVRWSKSGRAGIHLLEALSCAQVARVSGRGHSVTAPVEPALAD